jgi:hypothetical protein
MKEFPTVPPSARETRLAEVPFVEKLGTHPNQADTGFSANNPKVTFFMIVTDRDIIVADFAIQSYALIKGLNFRLLIYSNWLSPEIKTKYFPRWEKLGYVDIQKNSWQDEAEKPVNAVDPCSKPGDGTVLIGSFERPYSIWDRELRAISTPYFATADADFEILDGRFVHAMLSKFDTNPKLIAVSTDYSPTNTSYYDTYSKETIQLNERWHTWFCLYRREALNCQVSFLHHEVRASGPIQRVAWDDQGFFQKTLKDEYGYQLEAVDAEFQRCFIHYGAFNKNRSINDRNVSLYRRLRIAEKRGVLRVSERLTRRLFRGLIDLLYSEKERLSYQSITGNKLL